MKVFLVMFLQHYSETVSKIFDSEAKANMYIESVKGLHNGVMSIVEMEVE